MTCRGADLCCTHIATESSCPPPHTHACVCSKVAALTHASTPRKHEVLQWGCDPHDTRHARCDTRYVNMAKMPPCGAKYPRMAIFVNIRRRSHVQFGRMLIFDQNFDRNFVATRLKLTWRRIGREIDAVC